MLAHRVIWRSCPHSGKQTSLPLPSATILDVGGASGTVLAGSQQEPGSECPAGDANMQHSIRFLGLCLCVIGAGIGAAQAQDQGDQGMWASRWGARDPATAADTGLYVGAGYV